MRKGITDDGMYCEFELTDGVNFEFRCPPEIEPGYRLAKDELDITLCHSNGVPVRSGDAVIEGSYEEWQAIIDAMKNDASVTFRRCAAFKGNNKWVLMSPRNSGPDWFAIGCDEKDEFIEQLEKSLDEIKQTGQ